MKITICLAVLVIISATSINNLDNATDSQNLSNCSIFNYRLGCSNLESIHPSDATSPISCKGMKHTSAAFSVLIATAIFALLISRGRLKGTWKYHLIGIVLYMLIIQTQSQCYTNPNCSVCNSSGCSSCISLDYYVGGTPPTCKLCSTYIYQCKECVSYTNCTVCNSGYHTVKNNSECISCLSTISGCTKCTRLFNSSRVSCDACTNTLFPLNNLTTNSSICTPCNLYLNACSTCININTCTRCENDSFAVSPYVKKCFPCKVLKNGCKRCN